MAICVVCQACGRDYRVKDEAAGRTFQCKDCGTLVLVPTATDADEADATFEDPFPDETPQASVFRPRADSKRAARQEAAKEQVALPAMLLMAFAGLWIAVLVVMMGFNIVLLVTGKAAELGRPGEPFPHATMVVIRMIWNALMIVTSSFVLYGGWQMHKLRSRTMAQVAAVLSVIPCIAPCYCGGLPFGIWALVVLGKPEVRDGFD